jgi:hypothetical protein
MSAENKRKKANTKSSKGKAIRFWNGVYDGRTGWINTSKVSHNDRLYVIVDLGNGLEKEACVSVWSVSNPLPKNPKTYADALYIQKPAIEKTMKKLARQLVYVGAYDKSSRLLSVHDILGIEMKSAAECKKKLEGGIEFQDAD